MFEKNLHISCLIDTYGALISDRKRELLDYYYNEDYSLSEISEITGISRQGIRDSVKKSEAELLSYEKRLHLYEKKTALVSILNEVSKNLNNLYEIANGKDEEILRTVRAKLEEAIDIV